MIIRPFRSDLLLITQADHAALAARIMTSWQADGFPGRTTRNRALDATRLHDIGWRAVDAAPRIAPETGIPYDVINVPLDVRQGVWPSAIEELTPRDPYIAALVAQHAWTVYRRFADSPEWEKFFAEMVRRRDHLLSGLESRPDTFDEDYAIVRLGDRWSLVFCYGWQQPESIGRYQAILHGTLEEQAGTGIIQGCRLEITPDPFGGNVVALDVPARRVPARRYTSDADLRETVSHAPIVRMTGVARGGRD